MSAEIPDAEATTHVIVDENNGDVVTLPGHGFLQSMGFLMLPSSPAVRHALDFDALLREAEQASARLHAARMRKRRYPNIPKNAPRAVKTERVHKVLDPAPATGDGAVPPDATCVMCFEARGRTRSPAWRSPCCGLYVCDGCAMNFVRYPHRGLCEACTRCARSRGGAHRVPLGGPPGPASCTCKYICPQKCSEDGMRSLKVEMEALAAAEAAAKARVAARKPHRRPRVKHSGGNRPTKRRRV